MFEKYLNKNVWITTQVQGTGISTNYKGIITAIDDHFIELDNVKLISRQFVFSITIK